MGKRILFVDDEPNVLESLERMLHEHAASWEMTFLSDAEQAHDVLLGQPHDIAVLDVKLLGKDGIELLSMIKADARTRDVEVVMLTGVHDNDLKRRALDLGAGDLLSKPVRKEDLVARLKSALRMRAYHEELKARNAALEEQLAAAQRMELVGVLAAGVAHDLRNMLTMVSGYSGLIEKKLSGEPEVLRFVKPVRETLRHAGRLVGRMVNLSRRRSGTREPCDLGRVVSECLEMLRATLSKSIRVVWDPPPTRWLVGADETEMVQVILNLCLNAGQAMAQEGELKLSLSTGYPGRAAFQSAAGPERGPYAALVVRDTGPGMDTATQRRIFEPLFSTKGEQGGAGLGLAVVRRIVTDHGGSITVDSVPGKGTSFTVYLPLVAMMNDPEHPAAEPTHAGHEAHPVR